MLNDFISQYGATILYTIITAIAGYIGIVLKNIYERACNTKLKRDVAKTAVLAVEQIYKDLHGEEKLKKALEAATEMLAEKGIRVTSIEINMLIESALAEFNRAFAKQIE